MDNALHPHRSHRPWPLLPWGLLLTLGVGLSPAAGAPAAPHTSFEQLVSGNGHVVLNYHVPSRRTDAFLEHTYRDWDGNTLTRDFCFDTYFGLRVGGSGQWLTDVAPHTVEYINGTGIIRVVTQLGDLSVETFRFVPFTLDGPGGVMLVRVTNTGSAASPNVSLYSIHNFRLGNDQARPDTGNNGERIQWDAASNSFAESGPSGAVMVYQSLGAPSYHSAETGPSGNNPWGRLQAGLDLVDAADTGVVTDAIAGLQLDVGSLAPGASASWGVVLGFEIFGDAAATRAFLQTFIAGRNAEQLLADEQSEWATWRTAAPAGLSSHERALWHQSQAILRMGQVREGGLAHGGLVASMPPGNWNIVWVRDMAYAVVALIRTGHLAEARDALAFQLLADSGYYQAEVGHPYQISITRYFGNGTEETDFNANGPNIEFDGFGLFLWSLGEYHRAGGDDFWHAHWTTITTLIADVLVALQDPVNGLILPDSSIWEVHWNGMQRQFTYTSLAAVKGLCAAAELATSRGGTTLADTYLQAAENIQDAILLQLVHSSHVLGQSEEDVSAGFGYLDAAVAEAVNWGIVWPESTIIQNTFDAFDTYLVPASGRGFMRNDDGGWYDSQEWVFVDMRAARALRWAGRANRADGLIDWITEQARLNYHLIAELHDANNADYEGEVPMVGFGAGTYLIAVASRAASEPAAACCAGWGAHPDDDAGVHDTDAGDGSADASMPEQDAGDPPGADAGAPPADPADGCQCQQRTAPAPVGLLMVVVLLAWFLSRRRQLARSSSC